MSDELLNLSNELLRNEELLDVEAHVKKGDAGEGKDEGEVEAHLLEGNLLDEKLLDQ
jgi:hypothetical protein